jgi:L-threonylcarbamoyladenylate synthase
VSEINTELLNAQIPSASAAAVARAADLLRAGGIVAFPTETVYGLGASATNPVAVARIFEAKGRPTFDPLIVHIADRSELSRVLDSNALSDPRVSALADAFWPGPLTIVAPAASTIPELVRAGLPSVGVRLPDHDLARALIRATGTPIAAPSANLFGQLSPTSAAHVNEQLSGRIDAIIAADPSRVGVESTVVSLLPGEPARLLRPGGVSAEQIEQALAPYGRLEVPAIGAGSGAMSAAGPGAALPAPGMTASHYAPRAHVRILDLEAPDLRKLSRVALLAPDAATLAQLSDATSGLTVVARAALSERLDPARAASRLFELLHQLDDALRTDGAESDTILTTPYPESGLGAAIADRLRRASAQR